MSATTTVENEVVVPAGVAAVWARVVDPDGINHELRPWLTMTMPRGTTGLAIDSVPLGRPLGRAWLRLFGIVPFDFDRLVVVEVQPGRRFLERSSMLSMRLWEHERTLAPVAAGTRVHDRVTFRPRLPVPGLAGLLARVVDALFEHRHRRLASYFRDRSGAGPLIRTRRCWGVRRPGRVATRVRHRASGDLVAYTELAWPAENPAGVWQENTIVHGDHRGHRLGQRVKAANLTALLAENPHARRVHTWNANENRWMLAINDALGFAPIGLEGLGQKKV